MLIVAAEVILVEIPFELRGTGVGIMPTAWNTLEFALVKLTDEFGNVGWGEGFGYSLIDATKSVIERLIFPTLVGKTIDNIPEWNARTQRALHMFGRYGVTIFAISGVDTALWDLKAKRAGVPLARLLTEDPVRTVVPFYASLVRYSEPNLVQRATEDVLAAGFTRIKLHEVTLEAIRTSREVAGPDIDICVDVNCAWSDHFIRENLWALRTLNLTWLEEPIYPPEDFAALRALKGLGLPIAAGENWCTSHQFISGMKEGAVDYYQPSLTKVGGVSEYVAIANAAKRLELKVMPHSPYFGPGLFASLQVAAALPGIEALEYNFVKPAAWLHDLEPTRHGGEISVSTTPGIGFEPDPEVLARYGRLIGQRNL